MLVDSKIFFTCTLLSIRGTEVEKPRVKTNEEKDDSSAQLMAATPTGNDGADMDDVRAAKRHRGAVEAWERR